jgi:copper chaperone
MRCPEQFRFEERSMEPLTLNISGMSCGHCVSRVSSTLKTVAGVEVENVKVGSADVSYDPRVTSPTQIASAVENAGYQVQPAGQTA